MKPVIYRGGIVSFSIPANWREEYEPAGDGTFYEDGADTGTLRLHVISIEKKLTTLDAARREIFGRDQHEVLSNGFPLRHFLRKATERSTLLHLYRWEVLVPVPPDRFRVVCFTHTIVAALDSSARSKEELRLVDAMVRAAEYSTVPGVVSKNPWWKLW